MMQRPLGNEYRSNYQKYFDILPEGEFLDLLKINKENTISFFKNIPFEKHDHQYAPGKWTVKEVLLHIIDTEQVFSNRALMAARGDNNTIVGRMDENLYAKNGMTADRSMESLKEEFITVRKSTEILFVHISEEQSKWWCNIDPHPMTARAIAYFMIGHVAHHLGVVKERYL